MTIKPTGSLSRANKLILGGKKHEGSSVYTLHHWYRPPETRSSSREIYPTSLSRTSGELSEQLERTEIELNQDQAINNVNQQENHIHYYHHVLHKVRMLFVRAQETALNFFLGYFGSEERAFNNDTTRPPQMRRKLGGKGPSRGNRVRDGYSQPVTQETTTTKRKKKLTRSEFVIGENVPNLPDHKWSTIIVFIFRRWLTWANFIELLLIVGLFIVCMLQCIEILGDYYTYPSHVSVTRKINDDFRHDLPGLTLCNNNRMSRTVVKRNFPHLNYTHFRAISFGTFYSVENFSLPADVQKRLQANELDATSSDIVDDSLTDELEKVPADYLINWVLVARHFSNRSLAKFHKFFPDYDLIDELACANVWGNPMPCENLRRIESIQKGLCVTLFHDSVFWDAGDPAVRQLERAIANVPMMTMAVAGKTQEDGIPLLQFNKAAKGAGGAKQTSYLEDLEAADGLSGVKKSIGNMEVMRIKLDFRSSDYMVQRSPIGGVLAIHSNSFVANLEHIQYIIEPGFRYKYYISRTDYDRLPPPYDTNCYDYQQNRKSNSHKTKPNREDRVRISNYIRKQAASPHELQEDYKNYLRHKALSGVSTFIENLEYSLLIWADRAFLAGDISECLIDLKLV